MAWGILWILESV